ncbi:MAG: helix-turn-helix domain-containing protein [Ghiorsea sp.]|nr:helix-turn-helix domain-containing protein [Ghiorsea sp.]
MPTQQQYPSVKSELCPTNPAPAPKKLEEYPEIMGNKELADFLSMSLGTLYNKRSAGASLPPSLPCSKALFYRDDIEKWLKSSRKCGA